MIEGGNTMRSVLVANPKGGCGKTTIATNLAGAFAQAGLVTAIADVDPQRSSLGWLERRSQDLPTIHGLDWTEGIGKVGKDIDRLVIDAPAALTQKDFRSLLKLADSIVLPVLPSAFDQLASITFLGKIETLKPIRKNRKPVAVVANRVRPRSRATQSLLEFLDRFNHAPVMTLRESVIYTDAADHGKSVFDRRDQASRAMQTEWVSLVAYVD